ncbi:MAG: glutathione S-transferase family protein [Comamonadaceae bacterium]|nr:MAG: glutathione S-transferase family protein [Comamonadaceae bacterium]
MLIVHHLGKSQSERIVWLCEELGLPYRLQRHERDPVTSLSPPSLKAVHPLGAAPVIEDDGLVLAESGAIIDYLIARHGQGRLALGPADPAFADYLYWYHFANSNLQPAMGRNMLLGKLDLPADHPMVIGQRGRLERALGQVEQRLGRVPHLAGEAFTAADIMIGFTLTTMRLFHPLDLAPYPNIRAYLGRIGQREAYRRAMQAGDPDLAPMLD